MNEQAKLLNCVLKALKTQDELNTRLDADWPNQGWPYYRAAWTEMAEAVGHLNWFWWKQGTYGMGPSAGQLKQLHMELVDILHFGLSMMLLNESGQGATANSGVVKNRAEILMQSFLRYSTLEEPSKHLASGMEQFISATIASEKFEMVRFASVCQSSGLSLEALLVMYFGKCALNKFRWSHGYNLPKDDPNVYIKMWLTTYGLVEDNVVLSEILESLTARTSTSDELLDTITTGRYEQFVYDRLAERYPGKLEAVTT